MKQNNPTRQRGTLRKIGRHFVLASSTHAAITYTPLIILRPTQSTVEYSADRPLAPPRLLLSHAITSSLGRLVSSSSRYDSHHEKNVQTTFVSLDMPTACIFTSCATCLLNTADQLFCTKLILGLCFADNLNYSKDNHNNNNTCPTILQIASFELS